MKKHMTIMAAIVWLSFFRSNAQIVPNGNLAAWHPVGAYEEPDGWATTNVPSIVTGVTKVTDDVDGNYAARMETKNVIIVGAAPGGIGTGTLDIVAQTFLGGFPLNGNDPQALIGYYKYTPVNNDSCLAYAALFKWNATTMKRDTTGIAFFIGGTQSSYTLFSAPVFPLIPETPDSAVIIIISSKNLTSAQIGSVMYVDDIDLSDALGVNDPKPQALSLYPSPVDGSLTLNLPEEFNAQSLFISNTTGTISKQVNVTSGAMKINTESFSNGLYLCYVKDKAGKVVATGRFSVMHAK